MLTGLGFLQQQSFTQFFSQVIQATDAHVEKTQAEDLHRLVAFGRQIRQVGSMAGEATPGGSQEAPKKIKAY